MAEGVTRAFVLATIVALVLGALGVLALDVVSAPVGAGAVVASGRSDAADRPVLPAAPHLRRPVRHRTPVAVVLPDEADGADELDPPAGPPPSTHGPEVHAAAITPAPD